MFVFILFFVVCSVSCRVAKVPDVKDRIYRGYDVGMDQYPHATFLFFDNTSPASCGGSLIMVQAVLTAAHCVDELKYNKGTIHAYFGAVEPKTGATIRTVKDYEISPKYDRNVGRNNIAVVFLNKRVPLNHYIKKIPLASGEPATATYVFSSGWGQQMVDDIPPKLPDFSKWRRLKGTKQRVVAARKCSEYAGYKVTATVICTLPDKGHFYIDDSGDGLVLKQGGVATLVGVLSYVAHGASIHTSVYSNRGWIIKTLRTLHERNCKKRPIVV